SSSECSFFAPYIVSVIPRPLAIPTLFPYTTLFRSHDASLSLLMMIGFTTAVPSRSVERAMCLDCLRACRDAQHRARPLPAPWHRSEEHTSELQSRFDLVCRLLLEKKKKV